MATSLPWGVNIGQLNQPQLYNYEYDQLNRLVSMQAYRNFDQPGNSWSGISATTDHQESITYDGNGNITAYLRNGNTSAGKPLAMDALSYHYNKDGNGNLLNNKLRYVSDSVTANNNYTEDIDGQVDSSNYHYDQIGNLTHDTQEQIDSIEWNVYGKISRIWKNVNAATGALQQIAYSYDPSGNRISKTVYSNQDASNYKAVHTWYVRDASGNVMATYTSEDVAAKSTLATGTLGKLYLSELHMYGSSRLGIWSRKVDMDVVPTSGGTAPLLGTLGIDTFNRGNKFFELSNHLGNVLVTVSDRKVGQNPVNGLYSSYTADVVSASDYAPFGMQMVGRTFSAGSYRYGFNGKENDNEVKGEGNQQDYGMRIYDPRLGKFFSVDPISNKYPWATPYNFAANSPIMLIDVLGMGPGDPVKHTVIKGDNLSKIARKYGVSIKDIMLLNNIKDRNGIIKPGQILTVNPEADFTNNPRGDHYNPDNADGKEVKFDNITKVGIDFIRGRGEENSIIVGGKALESVKNWKEVQDRVAILTKMIFKDNKAHPGEAYALDFKAGSLPINITKGIREAMENYYQGKDIWKKNSQNSPIHVIGSFNISIRVNANGTTATIAVYDSKSFKSFSDNILGEDANRKRKEYPMPYLTNTYQRYLWNINL